MSTHLLLIDGVMQVGTVALSAPDCGRCEQSPEEEDAVEHCDLGAGASVSTLLWDDVMYVAKMVQFSGNAPDKHRGCTDNFEWRCDRDVKYNSPKQGEHEQTAAEERASQHVSNTGSVGHPHFCHRQCLYFAAGKCTRGETCGFCHHGHVANAGKTLGKGGKAILQMMDARVREELLAAVMCERISMMLPLVSARCAALVEEWYISIGEDQSLDVSKFPEAQGIKSSSMKQLIQRLRVMNLQVLYGIVKFACAESSLLHATNTLLRSLRVEFGS